MERALRTYEQSSSHPMQSVAIYIPAIRHRVNLASREDRKKSMFPFKAFRLYFCSGVLRRTRGFLRYVEGHKVVVSKH